MAKKDIQNRKKELQEEIQATKDLAAAQLALIKNAQTTKALSNEAIGLKEQLLKKLESEESVTGQINAVQEAIDGMLKEQIERGEEVNQHYIDQLDSLKSHLEKNKEIALVEQERNNLNEAGKGILKGLLGINSDIEEAVVSGGMKVLFLNKAFENVSKNVSRMVDGVKEGVTQLGLSVGESMHLQANIEKASFSLTGFLYGSEAVASAAKAITAEYGNVNAATTDLIKGVTEVSVLTGDATSALKLTEAFESAGIPADEVADTIKDISKEAGVSATMAVKGLEGQMSRLVGASEEELELIIKGNAELQKRGMTMSEIEGLANNMLDIESSMRSEAKARAMLGRDIGANEMRSLSARLMTTTDAKERAKIEREMSDLLLEQAGTAEEFNNLSLVQQNTLAEAYGMSREELATKIQTADKQKELTEKYGKYADEVQRAKDLGVMVLSGAKSLVIEMVKVAAKAAVMNVMMGKDSGIGNFFSAGVKGAKSLAKGLTSPIKSLGSLKDKAVDAFKGKTSEVIPDTKDMSKTVTDGGKAAGGGGMKDKFKDMAEGLKAMGDGKVFAGIGAVALAGPAFIVALPSIPFLLFMGLTPLKMLKDNFTGLSEGLQAMSKAAVGALVMALVGPALALGLLAIPFLAFMSIPAIGPAIQANFTALASGLAAFGNPGTAVYVLIGIGLMALLGAAMIPFAYALSLLSPLLEAFGNIVVGVMSAIPPIIQAVADGFVTMLGAITPEAIAGLMLLGPALMLASVGMIAFSAAMLVGGLGSFFGGGIIDDITELAMIGPQLAIAGEGLAAITTNLSEVTGVVETLSASISTMGSVASPLYNVAGGLYSIAGGLASISMAGLLASPVIGGLIGLASVAPALKSLGEFFGIGGDSSSDSVESKDNSNGSDKELLSEIKGLRQDLQSQPIVLNIDGKAVSRIQRVGRQQSNNRGAYNSL